MSYRDLVQKLFANHFTPAIIVKVKKEDEIITGIEVNVSPLLKDRTIERLKEIIGEDFNTDYVSTNECVLITKV
jgi:hypothetical protein